MRKYDGRSDKYKQGVFMSDIYRLSAFEYLERKGKPTGETRLNDARPRSVKKAKRPPKKKRLQSDEAIDALQDNIRD